jgi:hypothetical protein
VSNLRRRKPATTKRKRKELPKSVNVAGRRHTLTAKQAEILSLVRKGVTDFILERATMVGFFEGMRDISAARPLFSHQLTKAVFSEIVSKAVKKRLTRVGGRTRRIG